MKFSGTLGKCVLKKISCCGVEGFILSSTSAWCQTCTFGHNFYPARPAKKKNARPAPHRISPIKTPIFLFSLSAPRIGFTSFTAPLKTLRGEPRVCGVSNFCGTNKFALEFTACLDHFVDFALRGFETENSKMSNAFDDKQDHLV